MLPGSDTQENLTWILPHKTPRFLAPSPRMRENPSQKGDKSMNNIINQLSQIEEKTVAILDGAADKK